MFEGHHYQLAYVTRNLDKALADIKARSDIRHESYFEVDQPVQTPDGTRNMANKMALLWVGNVQYEFIQPVSGLEHVYGAGLPDDDAVAFHHVCSRVADWDSFRQRVEQQDLPLLFEGGAGPLKFLYLDGRKSCGHFLEYTWMPDEMWAGMGGE